MSSTVLLTLAAQVRESLLDLRFLLKSFNRHCFQDSFPSARLSSSNGIRATPWSHNGCPNTLCRSHEDSVYDRNPDVARWYRRHCMRRSSMDAASREVLWRVDESRGESLTRCGSIRSRVADCGCNSRSRGHACGEWERLACREHRHEVVVAGWQH